MKIGVSGCLSFDIIKNPEFSIQSWGGIAYNLLTLSLCEDAEVYPITYVGVELKERLYKLLPENVSTECIRISNATNRNTIHLFGENRYEFITPYAPEISIEMLSCPGEMELLMLNPVMGWEFSMDTLESIDRVNSRIKMIDVHNLTLGTHESGRRYRISLDKRLVDTILKKFHIIQMNREEYNSFTGKEYPEGLKDLPETIIFFITLASEGATVVYDRRIETFKPQRIFNQDIIGAGDISGSIFALSFLFTGDPFISCERTVRIMEHLEGNKLEEKIESIKQILIDTFDLRE